jgi:hypothetical protein
MNISKKEAAFLACVCAYQGKQIGGFDQVLSIGPDFVYLKQMDNLLTATILGTVDWSMWENNFKIENADHPTFGPMHKGFLESATAMTATLKPIFSAHLAAGGKISLQGHSRGGSLADIVASECALDGIVIDQLFLFEAACVGTKQYSNWACSMRTVDLSTTNGPDPVPASMLVGLTERIPTYPRVELYCAPGGIGELNLMKWHAGSTIYTGVEEMYPA